MTYFQKDRLFLKLDIGVYMRPGSNGQGEKTGKLVFVLHGGEVHNAELLVMSPPC